MHAGLTYRRIGRTGPVCRQTIPDQSDRGIRDSAFAGHRPQLRASRFMWRTHGLEARSRPRIDGVALPISEPSASTARIDEYLLYLHAAHCRRHGWATVEIRNDDPVTCTQHLDGAAHLRECRDDPLNDRSEPLKQPGSTRSSATHTNSCRRTCSHSHTFFGVTDEDRRSRIPIFR